MQRISLFAVLCAALVVSSCASQPPRPLPGSAQRPAFHPARESMVRYDINADGRVTAAELVAGLRADFATADLNHDGVMDAVEVRAVNAQRWSNQASVSTPLIDWNGDGQVDFHEFAAAPRALFAQLDVDEDGVLSPDELHRPKQPAPAAPAPSAHP